MVSINRLIDSGDLELKEILACDLFLLSSDIPERKYIMGMSTQELMFSSNLMIRGEHNKEVWVEARNRFREEVTNLCEKEGIERVNQLITTYLAGVIWEVNSGETREHFMAGKARVIQKLSSVGLRELMNVFLSEINVFKEL